MKIQIKKNKAHNMCYSSFKKISFMFVFPTEIKHHKGRDLCLLC